MTNGSPSSSKCIQTQKMMFKKKKWETTNQILLNVPIGIPQ